MIARVFSRPLALVFAILSLGAAGAPIRRAPSDRLADALNVKDFGARGDGVTDDAPAIQAAIDAAQAPGGTRHLRLPTPKAAYLVRRALTLSTTAITIEGDHFGYGGGSTIKADADMAAVFLFTDAAQNRQHAFRDLQIDANGRADYGIRSTRLAYYELRRVRVTGAKLAGVSVANGWNGRIEACELSSNAGDGLQLAGAANNAVTILDSDISGNKGWGILVGGGAGINVVGGSIQSNSKGGIYVVGNAHPINITSYFEANAATGYTFAAPALTVQADVVVNGSDDEAKLSKAHPNGAVSVTGSFFHDASAKCAVFVGGGVRHLRFVGNVGSSSFPVPAVGLYVGNPALTEALTAELRDNEWFSADVAPVGTAAGGELNAAFWESDLYRYGGEAQNVFSDDVFRYTAQGLFPGGSIARSGSKLDGQEVFELGGAATTDVFGQSIPAGNYPILGNRLVYFAAWVRSCESTLSGGTLYVEGVGAATAALPADTRWHLQAMVFPFPAAGTFKAGVRKIGTGAPGDRVLFAKPVLALVGSPYSRYWTAPRGRDWFGYDAAPSAGTWATGDRVWSSSPGKGCTPPGWICVSGGTPGVWRAMAPLGR